VRLVTAGLIGLIRLYRRTVSRLLPGVCRFRPSCSQYAIEALQGYGLWRGGWLALRRLARCHPFHPGGDDPVPPRPGSDDPVPSRLGSPAGADQLKES
jgi:putative membrane protein insertion efficiency factor